MESFKRISRYSEKGTGREKGQLKREGFQQLVGCVGQSLSDVNDLAPVDGGIVGRTVLPLTVFDLLGLISSGL